MGTTQATLPSPDALAPGQTIQIWMPSKHMGNLLMSLRSIISLVDFYGASRCTLIIDETYRDIIEASPLQTRVIYFPRKAIDGASPIGKLAKAWTFIRRTRTPRPYLAIAVEGDKVSQRFLPLSGCRTSAGPDNRYCRNYRTRLPLDHGRAHVFEDYAAVAGQITGETPEPGYPRLRAGEEARNAAGRMLGERLEHPGQPYAILHPCATKDYKQWPVESFARVAEYLAGRGINVVITGAGEFDRKTIERLLSTAECSLLSLHNRLGLGELIALMQQAALFIGNDTGPTHLAAATGIPTFAIFGPTDETLWGPPGGNVHILRSDVPCEPSCLRRRCAVDYRCMRTLAPATVVHAIDDGISAAGSI